MSAELPLHVKKYLEDNNVKESDLTAEALETYASLSGGEIALLRKIGESLYGEEQGLKVDEKIILKVH